MMKPRSSRVIGDQAITIRNKSETLTNGATERQRLSQTQSVNQQTTAQALRKRRSSISVYDQPSSINLRLRQLETDMIRLDEDRSKLFDDTHAALSQYELKLNEIHAILKSRQDNVEKYVEDMKILLQAKEDFERQAKMLNDKHDRIHEKFMHRETTIAREIKLLKNKFELLEKSRQFRSILQKSNSNTHVSDTNEDLISGIDSNDLQKAKTSDEVDSLRQNKVNGQQLAEKLAGAENVPIKSSMLHSFRKFFGSMFSSGRGKRNGNKIFSISSLNSHDPSNPLGVGPELVGEKAKNGNEQEAINPGTFAEANPKP